MATTEHPRFSRSASPFSVDGDDGEQSPAAFQFAHGPRRSGARLRRLRVDGTLSQTLRFLCRTSSAGASLAIQPVGSARRVDAPRTIFSRRGVGQDRLCPSRGADTQFGIHTRVQGHRQGVGQPPHTSSPFGRHGLCHILERRCLVSAGEDSHTTRATLSPGMGEREATEISWDRRTGTGRPSV